MLCQSGISFNHCLCRFELDYEARVAKRLNEIEQRESKVRGKCNKDFMYQKGTSIQHFEQCDQQLLNLICQNCDGSIKILLDVGNQQHAV